MDTETLLIIYTDGSEHKVSNVEDYGFMEGEGMYYFQKKRYRGFFPKESIKFIGRDFDYNNKESENR